MSGAFFVTKGENGPLTDGIFSTHKICANFCAYMHCLVSSFLP
jgi:hypothetical protein